MAELWLPASARGFTEVEPGIEVKAVSDEAAVPGPDDGIFLPVKRWGVVEVNPERTVPAAVVEWEPLRQPLLDGLVDVELYGLLAGFATASGEGANVNDDGSAALGYIRFRRPEFHVYFWLKDAPDGWVELASTEGFALHLVEPATGEPDVWLATGPMGGLRNEPIVLPGTRRGSEVGRNEPCPCGSELKFKRCCGG